MDGRLVELSELVAENTVAAAEGLATSTDSGGVAAAAAAAAREVADTVAVELAALTEVQTAVGEAQASTAEELAEMSDRFDCEKHRVHHF